MSKCDIISVTNPKEILMKNIFKHMTRLLALLLVTIFVLTSCHELPSEGPSTGDTGDSVSESLTNEPAGSDSAPNSSTEAPSDTSTPDSSTEAPTGTQGGATTPEPSAKFDPSTVPAYSPEVAPDGYVVINNNVPFFDMNDSSIDYTKCVESYGELDSLGRCTEAFAVLGKALFPTTERGSISSVKPTGWHSVTYPETNNQSLFNRSHLIAWALTGEDANEKNLVTGTTYMNQHTMQIFENQLLSYVKGNDTHVAYRVTPIFEGNNLVCSGVLMEARSVEDNGEDIMFCVYAYNIQKGIIIDYATGESSREQTEEGSGGGESSTVPFEGTTYDFSGFDSSTGKESNYLDRTGSDGWVLTGARIDSQDWIGLSIPQIILNGKTTNVGSLTSATVSGGISELYLNYGNSYKDNKIGFTVSIIKDGAVVASKTVSDSAAEQSKAYELHWVLDAKVEGDFVIKIVNDSPSKNSSSNKDRVSIWNLSWK